MEQPSCATCRWFMEAKYCHRFPPASVANDTILRRGGDCFIQRIALPRETTPDYWCGEHTPKPEAP